MPRRVYLLISLVVTLGFGIAFVFLPCFNPLQPPVCRGPSSEKWIALTFDDGPKEPYTSQVLDILKQEGVTATFFLVGENILKYPDVVRRIVREGHVVGNHTLSHAPLILKSGAEIRREIEGWEQAMEPIGLPPLKLFRAPHGWKTPLVTSILAEKGYRLIGWSRGVWDTDRPGTAILLNRLTKNLSNGEIILLHDGGPPGPEGDRSQTVGVLTEAIRYYRDLGFRFVTLFELLLIE